MEYPAHYTQFWCYINSYLLSFLEELD